MLARRALILLATLVATTSIVVAQDAAPRAARSVHLGWAAPDADWFHLEMTVQESVPGSYFMACGWNTGYFGIQELSEGRKVVIFSVWDPTQGDDPNRVKAEDRVELIYQRTDARIRRFGGEGTGGQCMADCNWTIGQPVRFLLSGRIQGEKTEYAGYLCDGPNATWRQLVAFRVRTGGQPLRGLYSFIEDFRRDTRSAQQVRSAAFGNGWVRSTEKSWLPLIKARFTASGAEWEARDTINAETQGPLFRLITGGTTQQKTELRSFLTVAAPDAEQPDESLVRFVEQADAAAPAAAVPGTN